MTQTSGHHAAVILPFKERYSATHFGAIALCVSELAALSTLSLHNPRHSRHRSSTR